MIRLDNPPEYLCRATLPHFVELDENDNFLPHTREAVERYGGTIPLAHPSEIGDMVGFFYKYIWNPAEFPQFVILTFLGSQLGEVYHQNIPRFLQGYGEHFAVANIKALHSAKLCEVEIQGNEKEPIYSYKEVGNFKVK